MQQVVSAWVGTTASGRLRYSGCNCCSTDAKKLFRSMCRKPKRSDWSWPDMMIGRGLQGTPPPYIPKRLFPGRLGFDLLHFLHFEVLSEAHPPTRRCWFYPFF